MKRPASRNARAFEADFLVDTGATDCIVARSKLRALGIRIADRDEYELADGSARVFDVGVAQFEVGGKITGGRVIFGPDDAEPILGLTVLESLGLGVDPKRRRLRREGPIALKPC